jgi:porin
MAARSSRLQRWWGRDNKTLIPRSSAIVSVIEVGLSVLAFPAAAQPRPETTDFVTELFAPSRSNLLGDMGGLRTALGNYGISLGLQETDEVWGNATGGLTRETAYDGLTEMSLGIDASKAFGWEGGIFNVSALQFHGRNISVDTLKPLERITGTAIRRSTRLWELWYQQSFFDGHADLKIGQQSVDQEFLISQGSLLFLNLAMGWPVVPTSDLYAGGPAYPLSSLGVRLRAQPNGVLTLLAGVFDDNPPGGPFNNDLQIRGAEQSGTKFNLNTGALFINEIQYTRNQPASDQTAKTEPPSGLPGTFKLGFWYDTGWFPDQRFDNAGLSLANPLSSGIPQQHHSNFSVYGVADQMIWRPNPKSPRALGVFARIMGAPGDRNLLSFSANGGVVLKAPLLSRDNDSVGLGFGIAKVSSSVRAFDLAQAFFTRAYVPPRGSETFIELTYQFQLAAWWQLQPDFQYIFIPGGGLVNTRVPSERIGNEAVFGIHTNIAF